MLRRTLSGYARHPEFAGVLMLGLGCETNQISSLMEAEGMERRRRSRRHGHPGQRRHRPHHRSRASTG